MAQHTVLAAEGNAQDQRVLRASDALQALVAAGALIKQPHNARCLRTALLDGGAATQGMQPALQWTRCVDARHQRLGPLLMLITEQPSPDREPALWTCG